jgi:hypothetical protein
MKQRQVWVSSSDPKKTNHHSGEKQEQRPGFTAKVLDITVTMKMSISQWKTRTKQNPNTNVAAATEFIPKVGRPRVEGDQVEASST